MRKSASCLDHNIFEGGSHINPSTLTLWSSLQNDVKEPRTRAPHPISWSRTLSFPQASILFISGSLAIWGFTDSTCFISSTNSLVLWSGDGTFSGCLVLLRIFSYFYIQLFQRGFERVERGQITHQVAIVMAVLTLSDLPPKGHP